MKLKDGKTLFKTLKVGLSCETCIQKCIPCTHKIRNLPSWKSTERQAKTEAIMATRSDQMNRELMGNIASSSRDYFLKKFVTPFRERLPYIFDECVNVIYTGQSSKTTDVAIDQISPNLCKSYCFYIDYLVYFLVSSPLLHSY